MLKIIFYGQIRAFDKVCLSRKIIFYAQFRAFGKVCWSEKSFYTGKLGQLVGFS